MSYNHNRKYEKAELGLALRRIGWTLYGWHDDASDSMTDYYSPAHWSGIAEKGGAVVVVGAYGGESGQEITKRRDVDSGPCPTCGGTGNDPSGWTLEKARANPREYHKDTLDPGCVSMFPDIVSPIPFRSGGVLRCRDRGCVDGRVISYESDVIGHWPTFQRNPKGATWHVERSGMIVAKGNGLKACKGDGRDTSGADALAARIDAAADGKPRAASADRVAVESVTLSYNHEKGGVELRFPSKPNAEVLDSLKLAGWRWSRFSSCWWHTDTPEARAYALGVVRAFDGTVAA